MKAQTKVLQSVPLTTGRKNLGTQELDELKRLAAPLVAWLRENYNPLTEIHISWDRVRTITDELSVPFPYDKV